MRDNVPRLLRSTGLAVIAGLLATIGGRAIELAIGRDAIERALTISRRPDSARAQFHAPYIIQVGDPTVDRIEVITEFRRVVLAAEERIRFGDHLFGLRDAETLLRPWRERVSIVAHIRLHPHNVYATVPPFEVSVASMPGEASVQALDTRRTPLYSLPPPSGTSSTLLGVVVEGEFEAAPLARAVRQVVVSLPPKELAKARIDFARLP